MLIRQQRGIASKPLPEVLRKKRLRIASLTHRLQGLSRVITLTEVSQASLPDSAVRKQAQGPRVTHPRSPAPLWQRWRCSCVCQSVLGPALHKRLQSDFHRPLIQSVVSGCISNKEGPRPTSKYVIHSVFPVHPTPRSLNHTERTHLRRRQPPCPQGAHRQHLLDFVAATLAGGRGVLHRPVSISEEVRDGLGDWGGGPLLLSHQAGPFSEKGHQG